MGALKETKHPYQSVVILGLSACIITFLPAFELNRLANPTISGKFLLFSAFSLSSMLFLLIQISKYSRITINKIDLAIFLIFAYINFNRYIIQDSNSFSVVYYELVALTAFYLLLRQFSPNKLLLLLLASIVGNLVQCIYGQLQILNILESKHSLFTLTGSFFNPGPYAGYITSSFPIVLGFYIYRQNIIRYIPFLKSTDLNFIKGVVIVTLVLFCLLILSTQSRAAWIASLGGVTYLLCSLPLVKQRFVYIVSKIKIQRYLFFAVLLILTVTFFYLLFAFKKDSASGRLLIWKITSEIIADHPAFGVGIDRFKAVYMDKQAAYFSSGQYHQETKIADNVIYTFNEPLQFIAENGIPSFFLLCWLVFLIFQKGNVKERNAFLRVVRSSIIAIGVFSLFSYPSQILPIKLNLVLFISFVSKSSEKQFCFIIPNFLKKVFPLLSVVALFISIGIYTCLFKFYEAYQRWGDAIAFYEQGSLKKALTFYQEAQPVFYNEGEFLTNYGKALTMDNEHIKAIKILNNAQQQQNSTIVQTTLGDSHRELQNIKEAEKHYMKAWNMAPSRLYPQYLLIKLYKQDSQDKKALEMAKDFLQKEPKIRSLAVEEMKTEISNLINNKKSIITF